MLGDASFRTDLRTLVCWDLERLGARCWLGVIGATGTIADIVLCYDERGKGWRGGMEHVSVTSRRYIRALRAHAADPKRLFSTRMLPTFPELVSGGDPRRSQSSSVIFATATEFYDTGVPSRYRIVREYRVRKPLWVSFVTSQYLREKYHTIHDNTIGVVDHVQ